MYALATHLGNWSGITTFTISSDGQTITELDFMNHDSGTGGTNSIIKVDSDTVAIAYPDITPDSIGVISTFDIDSDGNITKVDKLQHTTIGNRGYYNSLVQVDSDTYALAYVDSVMQNGGRIFISTFDIDSDGNITAVKTQSEGNYL